jgi:hypothetical protein
MIRLSNVCRFGRLCHAAGVIGLPPILSILLCRCCPSSQSHLDICDGNEVDDEVDENVGGAALLLRCGGGG